MQGYVYEAEGKIKDETLDLVCSCAEQLLNSLSSKNSQKGREYNGTSLAEDMEKLAR